MSHANSVGFGAQQASRRLVTCRHELCRRKIKADGFLQVVERLQKLNETRVSPKQCLSQCEALRSDLQKIPEALQAFSTHSGTRLC